MRNRRSIRDGAAILLATAFFLAVPGGLAAQQSPDIRGTYRDGTQTQGNLIPEPWHEDEIPLPIADFLRFAIVTTGSVPFSLFFVNETIDTKRWIDNGFEQKFTPWPFKTQYSYQQTDEEEKQSIVYAMCGAILLGAVDFVINRFVLRSGE